MLSDAAKMTESIHKVEAIINELPNRIDQLTNYRCPIQIGFKRTKKGVGTVTAEGYQSPEGFVVLKGSHISPEDDDTIFPAIRTRRKEIKVDTERVLQEDVLCRSPSFAAMLVIGKHANGLTSWKTKDGRTLKSLETT